MGSHVQRRWGLDQCTDGMSTYSTYVTYDGDSGNNVGFLRLVSQRAYRGVKTLWSDRSPGHRVKDYRYLEKLFPETMSDEPWDLITQEQPNKLIDSMQA